MLAGFCILVLGLGGVRHDFHSSIGELRYNVQEEQLELTLRLFTDDLQAATAAYADLKAMSQASTDSVYLAYLREHLIVSTAREPLRWQWVGYEENIDVTYFYALCKVRVKPSKLRIQHSILFDIFEDQVNIFNLYWGEQKSTLFFDKDRPKQEMTLL